MPLFSYVVRDKLKKVLKGTVKADSEETLRRRFHKQGYLVFSISKVNKTSASIGSLKLGKLLLILILIGGGYFLINPINELVSKFKEKKHEAPLESSAKEAPVIETPEIVTKETIHEPEQDIIIEAVAEPQQLQNEGTIVIALKGTGKPRAPKTASKESNSLYDEIVREYRQAFKTTGSKSTYRKIISKAQRALTGRGKTSGQIKMLRDIITNCREKLRSP